MQLRLRREAQMIAALNHPNIAQIHAVQHNALVLAGTGAKLLLLERTVNQGAPLIVLTNWIGGIK